MSDDAGYQPYIHWNSPFKRQKAPEQPKVVNAKGKYAQIKALSNMLFDIRDNPEAFKDPEHLKRIPTYTPEQVAEMSAMLKEGFPLLSRDAYKILSGIGKVAEPKERTILQGGRGESAAPSSPAMTILGGQ